MPEQSNSTPRPTGGYSVGGGTMASGGSLTAYSGNGGGGAASTPRESETQQELVQLDNFLNAIIDQFNTVEVLLQNVLRPPNKDKVGNPANLRITALGQALAELNRKASVILTCVMEVKDRIDL